MNNLNLLGYDELLSTLNRADLELPHILDLMLNVLDPASNFSIAMPGLVKVVKESLGFSKKVAEAY